jgi:hypothetical protein
MMSNGDGTSEGEGTAGRIAGLSFLKGLLLYGVTLTFAGIYAYVITRIANAGDGSKPGFSDALIGAGAALAGVLGSAFALVIGVPTPKEGVNVKLASALGALKETSTTMEKSTARLWQFFSFEPAETKRMSVPLTVGVWAYGVVGAAVSLVYILHPNETPEAVRALAVLFGGYVIAFVTAAYGLTRR